MAESSMADSLVLALVQEPVTVLVLAVAVDLVHAFVEETVLFVALSARSVACSVASAAAVAAVQQLLLAVADATS